MRPHRPHQSIETPEVLDLFMVIDGLYSRATRFSGVVVRSVGARYANPVDFFSGVGAAKTGGRWNRIGMEAVYASLDLLTATSEAYQNFIVYNLPLSSIRPRVVAGAKVSLTRVLDLTDASIRRKLGFNRADLVEEDWRGIQASGEESWTQALGRGCFQSGFEGILVPSARRPKGKNIVMFPMNFSITSYLRMISSDDLG